MLIVIAVIFYVAAMIAANLLVSHFGPSVTALNAFFLIGLDLALRDWLHLRLTALRLGALILFTSVLTYLLNPAAVSIAVASSIAFMASAFADWLAFSKVRGTWLKRAYWSNVVGALVDSILFPLLAFGPAGLAYAPGQFFAKTIGGAGWAFLLSKIKGPR